MKIHAWRIVKSREAAAAFSGEGARKFGGRWNSRGVAMVYTAGSTSLAILEMLVHLQSPELMKRYAIIEVTFDDILVSRIDSAALPKTWRKSPPPSPVQRIGDAWVAAAGSAVLRVPSAVVPAEWNYLLNPAHRGFVKINIGVKQTVQFDPRLIKSPVV